MTKSCAVPQCRTGYKSNKEKCSLFRVPKKSDLLKKWQAAIGVELKPSQHVCEKHFEKKLIIKEWIKRDHNGRLLARDPYKYPRLAGTAVPTIFHTSTSEVPNNSDSYIDQTESEFGTPEYFEDEKILPLETIDCAAQNSVTEPELHYCIVKSERSSPSMCSEDEIQPDPLMEMVGAQTPNYENRSLNICSEDEIHASMEIIDSPTTKYGNGYSRISMAEESTQLQKNMHIGGKPKKSQKKSMPKTIAQKISPDNNFSISTVTITDRGSPIAESVTSVQLIVPKSWAVTEFTDERGQSIILSRLIRKKRNDIDIPILEKCLTVDRDKALRYTIFGRPVNPEKSELPSVLPSMTQLLNILERFKNTIVCCGLGCVNVDTLPANLVFKDHTERWRDNDCSMVTKSKRCDSCVEMRQRVLTRNNR